MITILCSVFATNSNHVYVSSKNSIIIDNYIKLLVQSLDVKIDKKTTQELFDVAVEKFILFQKNEFLYCYIKKN